MINNAQIAEVMKIRLGDDLPEQENFQQGIRRAPDRARGPARGDRAVVAAAASQRRDALDPGAPPRMSTAPTAPAPASTTVHPVGRPLSV